MSYNDKTFGKILPTRNGAATGTSNERQMLDKIGGSAGYRKQYRTNPDGSVTMLTTKNGMPQFTTLGEAVEAAEAVSDPYLESGQLEWTFPGEENPTRGDPAKWHFLDIPTTDEYLGYIKTDGSQKNSPQLSENQESQAVGYKKYILSDPPKLAEIAQAPAADAASKVAAEETIILKKTVAGLFPPSLFSGKMRLFMQAQFGMQTSLEFAYGFYTELIGSEHGLMYAGKDGAPIQLSTYTSNSPGLFTAPDGSYWLIVITSPALNGSFVATSYKLTHDSAVRGLLQKLQGETDPPTAQERVKLEGYVFAHSAIDTANPVEIGIFDGASGEAMAYGWKWKLDGSEAKIVVNEVLGTGAADLRWRSATMTVAFSHVPRTDTEDAHITLAASTETHGEWTDGWGYFNIFVPYLSMLTAPLEHYSLATGLTTVKPKFTFPKTPVYGFYTKDVWTPISLSRNVPDPASYPINSFSVTGNVYFASTSFAEDKIGYGVITVSEGVTYEEHRLTEFTSMEVSVGDTTYAGSARVGYHRYFSRSVAPSGETTSPGNFIATTVGDFSYHGVTGLPSLDTPLGDQTAYTVTAQLGAVTTDDVRYTGLDDDRWTLVIPGWDSEAAYVAMRGQSTDITSLTHSATTGTIVTQFSGQSIEVPGDPPVPFSFAPWAQADSTGSTGYGAPSPSDLVTVTDAIYAPPLYQYTYCYNQELNGAEGTPGGSYSQIFDVDRNYALYDRGMYTYTSAGGRYVMSEGLKSPGSVNYQHRFVGWA